MLPAPAGARHFNAVASADNPATRNNATTMFGSSTAGKRNIRTLEGPPDEQGRQRAAQQHRRPEEQTGLESRPRSTRRRKKCPVRQPQGNGSKRDQDVEGETSDDAPAVRNR
jgi:hypothetical protein